MEFRHERLQSSKAKLKAWQLQGRAEGRTPVEQSCGEEHISEVSYMGFFVQV